MQFRTFTLKHGALAAGIATAGVIALGVARGDTSLSRYWQLKKSRAVLEKAVDDLRRENAALADEIVRLKESPSYAKKVLRDKYHVTEPDEDIVFFAE
jgi:cell division protein FtsB